MNAIRITDECKRIIQDHYGLNRPLTHSELAAEVKRLVRGLSSAGYDFVAGDTAFFG